MTMSNKLKSILLAIHKKNGAVFFISTWSCVPAWMSQIYPFNKNNGLTFRWLMWELPIRCTQLSIVLSQRWNNNGRQKPIKKVIYNNNVLTYFYCSSNKSSCRWKGSVFKNGYSSVCKKKSCIYFGCIFFSLLHPPLFLSNKYFQRLVPLFEQTQALVWVSEWVEPETWWWL